MPDIIAFKGYRYNKSKVKRFESVLAPPYDVISEEQQKKLYKKSPYNYVRIDLRKKKRNVSDKKFYSDAAIELNKWIKNGVFSKEEKDSIYVYEQRYKNLQGKAAYRVGFLSLMRINPRKVKKHENTLTGPKKDRTSLMESMRAQLSPIFGLFHDKTAKIHSTLKTQTRKKPVIDVKMNGIHHRMFVVQDKNVIESIKKTIKQKSMYIADGHHRFEVAYQYCKKHKKNAKAAYMITYLCDAIKNDFTIFPTHRVLSKLKKGWEEVFEEAARTNFNVEEFSSLKKLEASLVKFPKGHVAVGAYLKGNYLKLTTKQKTKDLDVTVLQKHLIRKLIGEDVAGSDKIKFTRDSLEAKKWVNSKSSDIALYLTKMPIEEMMRVSDEGVKLPQKSTYFYPKLLSGLVFYKF